MHSGQRLCSGHLSKEASCKVLTSSFGRSFPSFLLSLWSQWLFLSPFAPACLPWGEAGGGGTSGREDAVRALKPSQCPSLGVCLGGGGWGVGWEGMLRPRVRSSPGREGRPGAWEPSEHLGNPRAGSLAGGAQGRRPPSCPRGLLRASVRGLFRFLPPTPAQVTGKCVCRGRGKYRNKQ